MPVRAILNCSQSSNSEFLFQKMPFRPISVIYVGTTPPDVTTIGQGMTNHLLARNLKPDSKVFQSENNKLCIVCGKRSNSDRYFFFYNQFFSHLGSQPADCGAYVHLVGCPATGGSLERGVLSRRHVGPALPPLPALPQHYLPPIPAESKNIFCLYIYIFYVFYDSTVKPKYYKFSTPNYCCI